LDVSRQVKKTEEKVYPRPQRKSVLEWKAGSLLREFTQFEREWKKMGKGTI